MELNSDLTCVQGIVSSANKNLGQLSRIKYRGGNENVVETLRFDFKHLLTHKGYITDKDEIVAAHRNSLNDIVLFLILNTEFKENCLHKIKEFEHLVNIMPALSECLLVNVVIELNLVECYVNAMKKLPFEMYGGLMRETVPALKHIAPKKQLESTFVLIKEAVRRLNGVESNENVIRVGVDQLNDIVIQLLVPIARMKLETMEKLSKFEIYCHIGSILLRLFQLLLCCDNENEILLRITNSLIDTTTNMVELVTVDIFCSWAEVDLDGRALQITVAEEAYRVLEKYSKSKTGTKLMMMLGTMARKPKTLQEQIREADLATVVSKVNAATEVQRQWFTAFMTTKIFNDPASIQCLKKWHSLCRLDDVERLLKLSLEFKSPEAMDLIFKCVSNLSVENLNIALVRFFRQYGLDNHLEHGDIRQLLTEKLNTINHAKELNLSLHEIEPIEVKNIQMLLLQNPKKVVRILYDECIENSFYAYWLVNLFGNIKDVLEIESLANEELEVVFNRNEFSERDNSMTGVVRLVKMLVDTGCCDAQSLFKNILNGKLRAALTQRNFVMIRMLLTVCKEIKCDALVVDTRNDLAIILLDILQSYRCKFTAFSMGHIEIAVAAIDVLKNMRHSFEGELERLAKYSPLNTFYVRSDTSVPFMTSVFASFNSEDYGSLVGKLVKILSRCVSDEWLLVADELDLKLGWNKTIPTLTDTLILICDVANTQKNEGNRGIMPALKFYLQSYGITLRNILARHDNLVCKTDVIKNTCRLLRKIPESIKYEEGIGLVTLFSDDALKECANDRQFILSLAAIDEPRLSQMLAKKILG